MTNEEAIKVITTLLYNQTGVMGNDQREGVFMAVQALEKQIPKKPIWTERTNKYHEHIAEAWCPSCECEVDNDRDSWCPFCGQRLLWEEEND